MKRDRHDNEIKICGRCGIRYTIHSSNQHVERFQYCRDCRSEALTLGWIEPWGDGRSAA